MKEELYKVIFLEGYKIEYYLLDFIFGGIKKYGIGITETDRLGHKHFELECISEKKCEVFELIEILFEEKVLAVSLRDIVDDWVKEKLLQHKCTPDAWDIQRNLIAI